MVTFQKLEEVICRTVLEKVHILVKWVFVWEGAKENKMGEGGQRWSISR